MTYAEAKAEALECLDEYDAPSFALKALRRALDDPGQLGDSAEWRDALALLQRIFAKLEYEALAQLADAATRHVDDADALYRLAHAFIEQQLAPVAATLLRRAHALAPARDDLLTELVAALESIGRFAAARDVLAAVERTSFHTRYLFAFNTLMSGAVADARALVSELAPASDADRFMRARLDHMLRRYDAVREVTPLDGDDLRGWHFVVSGAILLHCGPPTAATAHGRYLVLEDDEALLREGAQRLATVLDAWGTRPPRVLAFDNPDSRRLGLALATILGVRCTERVLVPDEPGLLVIYDLSQVIGEVLGRLREHRPGQMLFAHAMPAMRELPVAADLTMLLAERVISPWARHTIIPRRPELPSAPPTERDEELAQRIVRAPIAPATLADLPQLRALALAAQATSAALQPAGTRERHWAGSPVAAKAMTAIA